MHVAFSIAPFHGHVNPTLGVVSELAGRGHQVSYATTAQFAAAVSRAGAHAVVYQSTRPPGHGQAAPPGDGRMAPPGDGRMAPPGDGRMALPDPAGRGAGYDLARGLSSQLLELRAVLPALISAFAGDPPDVVVCDRMCWAGRALAARCAVPAVSSVTTLFGKPRWSLGPLSASFDPASPHLPRLLAATSATLARHATGLTAGHLLGTEGAMPAIGYHPRAFEPAGGQFGPGFHFVGPCLSSRRATLRGGAGSGRDWRPPGSDPVILVSLGTVFNAQPELFRRCIDAFAGLSCHVVVALGGIDAARLGALPPNAQAHSYVSLQEVLRYARVFVSHAGMTSTMEALSLGVPIVAVPQISEQHDNAGRLAELGLGRCLAPAQQTPQALRQAVTAVMRDAGLRPRLDWMRTQIERAPGAGAAADVIENACLAGARAGARAGAQAGAQAGARAC